MENQEIKLTEAELKELEEMSDEEMKKIGKGEEEEGKEDER